MSRFLYAAIAAFFLLGSFRPVLAQTNDPETTVKQRVLTQAEARKKIENNGYSGVTAMKSGKKTTVAVSSTGKVSPVK